MCKVPRWDLAKFRGASMRIGTEMKSVGEVMAIGRTFPEVIQKALRMLDIGVEGLDPEAFEFDELEDSLSNATPLRIFAVAQALQRGMTRRARSTSSRESTAGSSTPSSRSSGCTASCSRRRRHSTTTTLREAKELGFADRKIAQLTRHQRDSIRAERKRLGIAPHLAQIDTLAAEYPAETNYLYLQLPRRATDVAPSWRKKVMVLGSGAYRIGSSVEFDWCCVNAVQAARELGYETMMVNYNPETVSTDYDVCDKLVFDEISFESVLEIYEREQPYGVVVSMGGQVPNNLAIRLHRAGVRILGTSAESIDMAEDRQQVQRPARPAGNRPAALGARHTRVRGRAHRGAAGRLPGAGAPELRALRRGHERGPREERALCAS